LKNPQLKIPQIDIQEKVSETELTEFIIEKLSPYFEIYRELRGKFTHWNQTRTVILDLGLFPNEKMINNGFPKIFFGIEVKCFNMDLDESREWNVPKFKDTVSQCLSYKYSKFGKTNTEPAFILLADNFNVRLKSVKRINRNEYRRKTNFLMGFMATQNVGKLLIYEDGEIGFKIGDYIWNSKMDETNFRLLDFYAGNRYLRRNPIKPY